MKDANLETLSALGGCCRLVHLRCTHFPTFNTTLRYLDAFEHALFALRVISSESYAGLPPLYLPVTWILLLRNYLAR